MNSRNDNKGNYNNNHECNHSLELLKNGKIREARELFEKLFTGDYTNFVAESGIKCTRYWENRLNFLNDSDKDSLEKARYFYNEWIKFEDFFNSINRLDLNIKNNIGFYVFNLIIDLITDNDGITENISPDLYIMLGVAYKKIGDFGNSIRLLKEALSFFSENANIISQLADCYALLNDDKKAKLLFREAFFRDPAGINLLLLESGYINDILSIIKELGIEEKEVPYWIPVYGRIFKIFDASRELLAVELNKLRNDIIKLENNYKDKRDNITKSKLINHYLWLYDYFSYYKKDKNETEELEEKIKNISLPVYNIFKNRAAQ